MPIFVKFKCGGRYYICLACYGLDFVLPGGNLPFVLRNKEINEFAVVGHAYGHGAVDGEILLRVNTFGLIVDEILSKWITLLRLPIYLTLFCALYTLPAF